MQWDVAVNHTHQSRAGAQKRLPVQRKLAFLVFQGKKSFCASQTLAVPAHLTWISIFSGALTQHCTGIRKMHSNVGFSAHLWDDLRWNHSLVGSWGGLVCQVLLHLSLVPGELQGKGEQEKPQRVTQRGGGLGISGQLQTRCALRERAVFDWTFPWPELGEAELRECSGAAGALWSHSHVRKSQSDSLQDKFHLCYLMCSKDNRTDIIK